VPNSGIDPTGERLFATPPPVACGDRSNERYFDQPLGQLPSDDVSVDIEPRGEIIAPVGSEVVLAAGVCGGDGYLRTNRRLEWSIDPSSVGQFVAVEEGTWTDLLLGDFNRPRKITNVFAIGSTGRDNVRLNRGTCRPEDAVYVLRGQGWISLTSAVEGTSRVTVFAPEVYGWDTRLKSAVVHWIDAQWQLPPPAINPAGSKHVLTTVVTRHSNQTPCERWHVRYQVIDGPPAVFLPAGTPAIEVPTDAAGQASVELVEREPRHGTNSIAIQIIRPGDLPGANGQRLIVGSGATLKTWTAADLALKTIGPAVACPGTPVTYQIQVSNPGDLPAKDVVATDAVPEGLTLMTSSPPGEVAGRQLRWRLGELGARQVRTICVTCRAEKPGSIVNCCEAVAAGGLRVSDCATTTVALSSLELRVTGPSQAAVGSKVRFEIAVTNRTAVAATGLLIVDRLDPGLENPAVNQRNAIERPLADLAPGTSQLVHVNLTVTRPGRLCHAIEVTGKDVAPARQQVCLMGVAETAAPGPGAAAPPPGPSTPNIPIPSTPGTPSGPSGPAVGPPPAATTEPAKPEPNPIRPSFAVKKTGPKRMVVGEMADFSIELANTGSTAMHNIKVFDHYDPGLLPKYATDGYRVEDNGLAWTVDELAAGQTTELRVQCLCQKAGAKTCNRVKATMPDGSNAESEACLEISAGGTLPGIPSPKPEVKPKPPTNVTPPPPASTAGEGLNLSVVGLSNPVRAGKQLTYEIRVTNTSATTYRELGVTAILPDAMVFSPLGTAPAKFSVEGQTVRFDKVPELRPGDSLVCRVRVQSKQPGRWQFRAELTAAGLAKPLQQEAGTEVD
jgi:uncharacterized repeat protein (TIGR01451 family)